MDDLNAKTTVTTVKPFCTQALNPHPHHLPDFTTGPVSIELSILPPTRAKAAPLQDRLRNAMAVKLNTNLICGAVELPRCHLQQAEADSGAVRELSEKLEMGE